MRLYRKHGNATWYGWYYDLAGRRVQKCLKTEDKREAFAKLRYLARVDAGAADPSENAPAYSVHAALNDLVKHGCTDNAKATIRMYTQRGGQIARLLGARECAALSRDDVQEFIDTRLSENASRETVRKELVTIHRALLIARDRGLWDGDLERLMPRFRVRYTPRKRWLSPEQFDQLLTKLSVRGKHRRLWLILAANMGGRYSEVARVQWSDVDLSGRWLHVRGTKTKGSERNVPISDVLAAALEEVDEKKRKGPVAGQWQNVRRSLRDHCKALGFEPVSPNDLRRTFASWLKQRGADSLTVARLMGHTTSRMVDLVYGHLTAENLKAAVALLPGSNPVTETSHKPATPATSETPSRRRPSRKPL